MFSIEKDLYRIFLNGNKLGWFKSSPYWCIEKNRQTTIELIYPSLLYLGFLKKYGTRKFKLILKDGF